VIPNCSRNQRITSGFSGSPAEQVMRNCCGYFLPASDTAVIARSAVGVVNMFVTPCFESWRSCSSGSKPPLRA
jgi:hypothetical protein